VVYGFKHSQAFKWAVQCKFSRSLQKAVNDKEVRDIEGILRSSRYQSEKFNGYMLITNRRISQNVIERLRGINDQTSFRTWPIDGIELSLLLQEHKTVACRYFEGVKTSSMLLLTGEYQHVVDNKGRVLISNKLRNQIDFDEHGNNFYLVLGANGILCLYPERYFERIVCAVTPGTVAPDEAVVFERISFALASKVELDDQGRLFLSERLRKRAGLKNHVTLIGVRDHAELWNTDDWEQYLTDHMAQYQEQISHARQTVLRKEDNESL
jgi:MraZ protein